jgi:tetratricopeptide (TPR) repeat protein
MMMFLRSTLVCGFVAVACATARADDKYILGKDDEDFARELNRAGYVDLARQLSEAIQKTRGGEKSELLNIDLSADEASREKDPKKRVALLLEIVKQKEAYADKHKGSEQGDVVVDSLPLLYQVVGESIAAAIQGEQDAGAAASLRNEGVELFKRAERALNEQLQEIDKQREAKQDDITTLEDLDEEQAEDPLDRKKMLTMYSLIRTYYFHALLLEDSDADKPLKFSKSVELFQEFQLDFANSYPYYEGYVYEGLCHEGLGKTDEAIGSYDAAIKIRENWEKGSTGVWPMPAEAAHICSWAVLQKMTALAKKNDDKAVIAAADDFLNSTPDAFRTMKGLAVLAAKADACSRSGDSAALEAAAKKLIEIDPQGLGGQKGRDLLGMGSGGGGKGLGFFESLRAAEQAIARNEVDLGITLCQRVIDNSRGTKDQAAASAQACLLLGIAEARAGRMQGAVVAWETAAERFGPNDTAGDALWRAVNGWLELYAQEQRGYYKTRSREAVNRLLKDYPNSPQAAMAQLWEGRQLDAEGKFLEAAKSFDGVPEKSPAYGEALYRSANSYANQVRTVLQKDKKADVKALVAGAESRVKKAREVLEAAARATLDTPTQARLLGIAFAARVSLAGLYLVNGVDRSGDVEPLLEGIETQYPGDGDKLSAAWGLRIRALQNLDKVDDAITQLDQQLAKDPKTKGIGPIALAIGRALDQRAQDLVKEKGASPGADAQFQRAVKYYLLSVAPQVDGREPLRVDAVEAIADRLLALGLQFNAVPETVASFVDWTGKRKETAAWTEAARLYELVVPLTPSYRTQIHLAQAYGYLGKFKEAASTYAQLFDHERFVNAGTKKIDPEAQRARPELLLAYVEYGVALREAGVAARDEASLERASGAFEAIVTSVAADSKTWWQAKYWQVQLLVDRGRYDVAEVALRSVRRTSNNFDDGRFGYRDRFVALEEDVKKKLPPQQPKQPQQPQRPK